jgi:hypothetical protein
MKTIKVILFLLLTIFSAYSGNKLKNGLAISGGFGNLYGGIGLCLEYQIKVYPLLRFTPFGSLGFMSPLPNLVIRPTYCAGVNAEIGRFHRLFIGPSFGVQYLTYKIEDNGGIYDLRTVIGPALTFGYKGMARNGIMWQFFLGGCYYINDVRFPVPYGFAPVFGLGIGYKF